HRLTEDLRLAARVLQPRFLKLVGGEPLLHPQLLALLEIAKNSNVAPVVSITTNGHLLPKMTDAFWKLLDHITVSVYPDPELSDSILAEVEEKCWRFDVILNIKTQEYFQEITPSTIQTSDMASNVYAGCWMKRRCHMIRDGRFYMCTRPVHLSSYFSD